MNDTVPANHGPDRVTTDAEGIIKYLLSFEFPAGAFDNVGPAPHRISTEAVALRILAMKGRSFADTVAVAAEILTEVELHRLGYDEGYEAGYAAAQEVITEPAVEVPLTITPGSTPARELPFGMISDVCAVLAAYGLRVNAPELAGHGTTEVMLALGRVVEVIPFDLGGRAGVERPDRTDRP